MTNRPKMVYHRGYTSMYPMQFMPPALHEIGSIWEPRMNHINVYHSSGVDYCKDGWRKWNSAGHWDMHAQSATAVYPDWYKRRQQTIRDGDLKMLDWNYDRYYKATQFQTFGRGIPDKRPVMTGLNHVTRKPEKSSGQIEPAYYGLTKADYYSEPCMIQKLPPLHDPKHQ